MVACGVDTVRYCVGYLEVVQPELPLHCTTRFGTRLSSARRGSVQYDSVWLVMIRGPMQFCSVGWLFRPPAESPLTWPDLRNFAPYPYLPPPVLPASPCPPPSSSRPPMAGMMFPSQRSAARVPLGKTHPPSAYLRRAERRAMFLLAHPFPRPSSFCRPRDLRELVHLRMC